jgi:hypothetical protein
MAAAAKEKQGASRAAVIVGGIVLLAVLMVIAYLIKNVFDRPTEIGELCAEVLPQDKRIGMKTEYTKNGVVKLDLTGQRGVPAGASPEQIEKFIQCLERAKEKVIVESGVRLPLEPLGQVANRWKSEHGLQLRLLPGANDEVLYNLRLGPAAGLKENVIREWCTHRNAGRCVTCEPTEPTVDTVEVLVSLRRDAPAAKRKLDGVWPLPPPGVPVEPWQLVNEKGERFYYECRSSSSQLSRFRVG